MVAVKMAEAISDVEERARLVPPRDEIAAHHLIDEQRLLDRLIERAVFTEDERRRTTDLARRLVHAARADRGKHARRRRLHARVWPFERGRRHPHVHRRGAAAHPRHGDGRRAHRREDLRRPLGEAPRPLRQPARQRLDLGADAHRPRRQAARGARRQPDRRAQAPRRPLRRAGHPPGRAPGREGARRPVRARPHHPGGAGARQGLRGEGLPLLLRHAGRGGAHAEGRRHLLRALPGRDRRRRPVGRAVLRPCTPTRSTAARGCR